MASVVLRRKRAAGVLIAAVLLLLLAGSKPAQQLPAQADQEMERVSIAVLPFGELGSTPDALGHLAAVLTLTISDRLAQVPSFEVRPVAQFPRAGRDGLDAAGYAPGVVLTGALLAGKSEL